LEATLSRHEVEWVAMPSEAQMNSVATRRCIRMHCFDFVAMPSTAQQVVDIVGRAHAMCLLQGADVLSAARGEGVGAGAGAGVDEPMGEMIGECEAMQQLVRAIGKVAYAEAPVLVFGESGTGKELTAQSIHRRSLRAGGPFMAINCGAIAHHLLQSELFGYERGAFTGANARKIGHVEAANGGTLFLDEIGDLPLESQASLLRFLQERTIQRPGGVRGDRGGCAHHFGDARRSGGGGARGAVPRGLVSPAVRAEVGGAAAARAGARYRVARAPDVRALSRR
jgi:DNA-binding NtrC family response regulator